MAKEISAIRRSSTAEETIQRFFQTSDQIITHLKRESDREKIYALVSKSSTLTNLLTAACAIHCYHYLGIRTHLDLEAGDEPSHIQISQFSSLEQQEKQELYAEIRFLTGDAIKNELLLSMLLLDYQTLFLDFLKSHPDFQVNPQETESKEVTEKIISILQKTIESFPISFLVDHISDLLDLSNKIKDKILKQFINLRPTSVELEKQLLEENQQDKYIEITTFSHITQKLQSDFQIKAINEFKINSNLTKQLCSRLFTQMQGKYIQNQTEIEFIQQTIQFKRQLLNRFLFFNSQPGDYETIEADFVEEIQQFIRKISDTSSLGFSLRNLLIYILDCASEVADNLLNQLGIQDELLFGALLKIDIPQFFNELKKFQITKMDVQKFSEWEQDKIRVDEELKKILSHQPIEISITFDNIVQTKKSEHVQFLQQACQNLNLNYASFLGIYAKLQVFKANIQSKYPLQMKASNYAAYTMIFDFASIFYSLSRYIYFNLFSNISRHIARILECYVKLKEDRSLFFIGMKQMLEYSPYEKWIAIKIEELIIKRLHTRQEDLSILFNAEDNALLTNSFILARLFDINLEEARLKFINEASSIYLDVVPLKIPFQNLTPVSYVFAYDILQRFKRRQLQQREKNQETQGLKEEKMEAQKAKLSEKREAQTLDWIEKKINSTLIAISAVTVNPTALYWSEKDQQIVTDNIVTHCKLQNRKICTLCGADTTDQPCGLHGGNPEPVLSFPSDLFAQFHIFALNRMKTIWSKLSIPNFSELQEQSMSWITEIVQKRLRHPPTREETQSLLDGERRGVAQKIATQLGESLDNCIYKKFKEGLKKG